MNTEFEYDVFLSHSAQDKAVVRDVAERLREDGLKVWFDEWVLKPGDSIPAKIEEGLEHSRVLVLCMSAYAFGSDWAQLEAGTFRFRDPLNKDRRFIPLRLDDAPAKGSLPQFLYIDWRSLKREIEYPKLVDACRPPLSSAEITVESALVHVADSGSSGVFLFLQEKVESEFELLNREKITPWVFFTSHGVSIEGPGGRKWSYAGVAFDGSPREVFWNNFLQSFMQDITWRSFDEVRDFCERRGLDVPSAMNNTARLLKVGLARSLNRMVEIDQRLRGNGFPKSAQPMDVRDKQAALEQIINRRLHAEIASPVAKRDPIDASVTELSVRPIGDAWSGLRGLLEQAYSTKVIKGILGKAGLPIFNIQYTGTFKGPVLDEADKLVRSLNEHARDQFVVGSIQEVLALERIKAANLSKHGATPDNRTVEDLRLVLARFGHHLEI